MYDKKEKREKRKKERGIVNFMMITHHFFHSLREWLLEIEDPRHQSYIIYTQADSRKIYGTNEEYMWSVLNT